MEELEYISFYYPYDLKMIFKDEGGRVIDLKNFTKSKNGKLIIHDGYSWIWLDNGSVDNYKPILRPLSYLTKEITIDGETFIPIEVLEKLSSQETQLLHLELRKTTGKITIPITLLQMLLKWHFDIFGLIAQNKAVDYYKVYKSIK